MKKLFAILTILTLVIVWGCKKEVDTTYKTWYANKFGVWKNVDNPPISDCSLTDNGKGVTLTFVRDYGSYECTSGGAGTIIFDDGRISFDDGDTSFTLRFYKDESVPYTYWKGK